MAMILRCAIYVIASGFWIANAFAQPIEPSGQYPGVYVLEGSAPPVTADDYGALQLKCLLAPSTMYPDGVGAGYFLDRELFRTTGAVSYIKGQEYRCRFNPETRKETCESKEFSDGKSIAYYRSNVYEVFTQDVQRGHSLMTPEDVVAWNSRGEVNVENRFAYHRCSCLTSKDIEALASPMLNPHSSDDTGNWLFWWRRAASAQEIDLARQVVGQFGACRPSLS
jgi:hypothetical protein